LRLATVLISAKPKSLQSRKGRGQTPLALPWEASLEHADQAKGWLESPVPLGAIRTGEEAQGRKRHPRGAALLGELERHVTNM